METKQNKTFSIKYWFDKIPPSWKKMFFSSELDLYIKQAGNPPGWTKDDIAFKRFFYLLITGASALFLFLVGVDTDTLMVVILIGIVAYMSPKYSIKGKAKKRIALMRKELLHAIELINVAVEAGAGLPQAIQKVSLLGEGPFYQELRRAGEQLNLGVTLGRTLSDLAARAELAEIRVLVGAINQANKYGTPLARVLREQSALLRETRKNMIMGYAQTAQVKIFMPLVFVLLPALGIIVFGPMFQGMSGILGS